jgi:signal transduction histidine kinase
MINRQGMRFRLAMGVFLVGVVTACIYSAIFWSFLSKHYATVVPKLLKHEKELFLDQYSKDVNTPPPNSSIKGYIGTDLMPPSLRQQVEGLAEGIHEIRDNGLYYIAVQALPDRKELLYLISSKTSNNKRWMLERKIRKIREIFIGGLIPVIGVVIWMSLLASRRIIAPLTRLANLVGKAEPGNLPKDLSKEFANDELGMLARTFESTMSRLDKFIEREQQFTRDVSHELRNPVTVIKGALELLKQVPDCSEGSNYFKRIERSVNSMEGVVETLLWLAREDTPMDLAQTCAVLPVVQESIRTNRHILDGKPVEVELVPEANPSIADCGKALAITISNIVQNAFYFTSKGKVALYVRDDRVEVVDTGIGIEINDLDQVTEPYVKGEASQGFGMGLAIVDRLCARCGWHLEIDSEVGRGTRVLLIFPPSNEKATQT